LPSSEELRVEKRRDALLAAVAFGLGWIRGWSLPTVSDGAFHLVRAGTYLLSGSLDGYASPPGGDGAPPLGALVGALGALAADSPQSVSRFPGGVLLGASAAAVGWILARRRSRALAVLGVAFLLLPPAFASAFNARPDAALGGCLLVAAMGRRLRPGPTGVSAGLGWLAALATPIALPAALGLELTAERSERRDPRRYLGLLGFAMVVALLSVSLPAGRQGEILRAIFTGWTLSFEGIPTTLVTIRRLFAYGSLLAVPLVVPLLFRQGKLPKPVLLPWLAALAGAILFSEPEAFRLSLAALLPPTALVLTLAVAGIPEQKNTRDAPPRIVLLAMLIPVALLIFGTAEDRNQRRAQTEESARYAQTAEFLEERYEPSGAVLSELTGALAVYSKRIILPLGSPGAPLPLEPPQIVLWRAGMRPSDAAERSLFQRPDFLGRYAPLSFRRGRTRAIVDFVWVPRSREVDLEGFDPRYPTALLDGWDAHADSDPERARAAFRLAAEREPAGLGIAHEWLGVVLEMTGESEASEEAFRQARGRDPTTVRARGHLIDRALSAGQILRADTLLTEALRFNSHESKLWGTRARLTSLAGYLSEAVSISHHTVTLDPRNARILMNHGSLLWANGEQQYARELWSRAVRIDSRILRYLGDFENAPDDSPPPPLLPLFSFEGFSPEEGLIRPSE
jgi:tetratricopeptide (TPR) repeat protein